MADMDNSSMYAHLRAVLFDLEDTLLDTAATRQNFLVIQWQSFLDELLHIPARTFVETVDSCFREFPGLPAKAYQEAMLRLHLPEGLGEMLEQDRAHQAGGPPRLYPEVVNLVRDLSRHVQIGLVSNGRESEQIRILKSAGILPYFRSVMVSETKGRAKPAFDLFIRCLHELEVHAEEAVMVGDNREEDIYPAMALGMHTVWFKDSKTPRPENCKAAEVIEDLRDLPYALRNLAETPAG